LQNVGRHPNREMNLMSENRTGQVPRQVLLFSGHMIDAPERKERRFPPDNENIAAAAIGALLHKLDTGERDLAICGGACGGDLLFAEGSVARGAKLELYIPFDEQTFLVQSVDFADASWRERFYAAKTRATLHVMSDELSPLPSGEDPYERNNLWMLKSATRFGWDKVAFITLWNGQGGDGPGGTKHLMDEIKRKTERVYWLDTRQLWS